MDFPQLLADARALRTAIDALATASYSDDPQLARERSVHLRSARAICLAIYSGLDDDRSDGGSIRAADDRAPDAAEGLQVPEATQAREETE